MKLRTLIFWPHLIAGVIAGVVILIMSVTGALLTYERQMIAWADGHLRSTPPAADARPLGVEELLTKLRASRPDLQPASLTLNAAPDAPVMIPGAQGQPALYVDAYSGAILGNGTTGMRAFMSELRAWHRWLAVEGEGRASARAITGWSNVLFLFIVVSGMYLWLPKFFTWKHIKPVLLFNGKVSGKARDFNWHNVIGIWSAVPLFIVVISAVPISFPWGNALVYRAVGEAPPAAGGGRERGAGRQGGGGPAGARAEGPRGEGSRGEGARAEGGRAEGQRAEAARAEGARPEGPRGEGARPEGRERRGEGGGEGRGDRGPVLEGLNARVAQAAERVPDWRTINLRVPAGPEAPVVLAIDRGDGGQPHLRSTLTVNRATGEVVSYEAFTDLTLGRRIRNIMRFAHTGEVLGIPGQTVAGLVTAGGAVLVWTGIALTLRRFRAWLSRRRHQPSAAPALRSDAA